ncbi:MAG: SDR family NAD(P)-dependent oxidoreductase [bacterium]|nr:SDR family NAD(P)-dependent oxidoreductase [bacterium]MDE0287570.1 SDR family NAD(P)-dependent oxidoreductase [bacterium]MDE0440256.1 SDR family NAD(P)-dependent oxidoreductase [bacterium]
MAGTLEGKVILVTGASRGIGYEIAREVGRAGATVVAHYSRTLSGAESATEELPPDRKLLVQADFSEPGAGGAVWKQAVDRFRRIDVLVNNAAILPSLDWDGADDEWDRTWRHTMQVNVYEPARITREAVRHFVANGGGTLITLSSWLAYRAGRAQTAAYSASKGAVTALTKAVASDYARQGVMAFNIAPGMVRTQMSVDAAKEMGGEEATAKLLTMGEWIPPVEIARLVVFLSRGDCRHLSGATIDINGASYMR